MNLEQNTILIMILIKFLSFSPFLVAVVDGTRDSVLLQAERVLATYNSTRSSRLISPVVRTQAVAMCNVRHVPATGTS